MIDDKLELEQKILFEPAKIEGLKCSSLRIITGYTDVGRISSHLIELKDGIQEGRYANGIKIELILGMAKSNGLSRKKHEMINQVLGELNSVIGMPKIKCFYVVAGNPVHSKVYIWSDGREVKCAYCGSANYSLNALGKKSRQREYMEECDASEAMKYYRKIKKDCIECNNEVKVEECINFSTFEAGTHEHVEDHLDFENLSFEYFEKKKPIDTITVSLLKSARAGNDVGYGSGINWGIRPNGTKRNPNQAYIPYNKVDRKNGFFPDKRKKGEKNCPIFKVVTKEKGAFYMRVAQQGEKALQTPQSNAILGVWLREILRLESGTFITKQMLEEYGKTKVTFRKYREDDEDIYTLEF